MGGADGGWLDWWVAAVVGVSVVGEAAIVGVSVGAGDGVAGCADGGGWEGGPVSWWFVRVSWLSVNGAAFGGVLEGGAGFFAGSVVGDALVFSTLLIKHPHVVVEHGSEPLLETVTQISTVIQTSHR